MAYHITPSQNTAAIIQYGLVPQVGARSQDLGESRAAIYLFETIEDAEDALGGWLGESFDEDEALTLLEVNTMDLIASEGGAGYEMVFEDPIDPSRIKVLHQHIETLSSLSSIKPKKDIAP